LSDHPYTRREGDLVYAITQDALDGAAGAAAATVEGVVVATHRLLPPRGRGAAVTVAGERVRARLEIACRYGVALPDAARRVQEAVAAALERLTGLAVEAVDVEVVAVTRP
jgi:uncharacterized alkaline shock family protein YloU